MMKYWFLTSCLLPLMLCARQPAEQPRPTPMQKTDAPLPVYTTDGNVYLEFPRSAWGRELLITAQIDEGFDLIGRPAQSLGVVRLRVDEARREVRLEQPFYAERLTDPDSDNRDVFLASGIQSNGQSYPIERMSPEGGALINVTDILTCGSDWFDYSYQTIGGLDTEHAAIGEITPLTDGVCFHISRRHGYSPRRESVSSAIMVLPEGSMPLQVSCTVRLLPDDDMPIRLAVPECGYRTISFADYSQDPYRKVTDELLVRWRPDTRSPQLPTWHVDKYFPAQYLPAVHGAVQAWNERFRRAGIDHAAMKVEVSDAPTSSARAAIAYDLGTAAVERTLVCHPRTGEILSARINVGHGFLAERLDNAERNDEQTAVSLLQNELFCAIGEMLGLNPMTVDPLFPETPPLSEEAIDRALTIGYYAFPDSPKPCDDRELLRRRLADQDNHRQPATTDPVKPYAKKLARLKKQLRRPNVESSGKVLRLYGECLKRLAAIVGGDNPDNVRQEALNLLADELFAESHRLTSGNEENRALLLSAATEIFTTLLSDETVTRLQRAEWRTDSPNDVLTATRLFSTVYTALFNDFEPTAHYTYEQLDMMLALVNVWKDALNKEEGDSDFTAGRTRLAKEWDYVDKRLATLASDPGNPSLQGLFAWMRYKH